MKTLATRRARWLIPFWAFLTGALVLGSATPALAARPGHAGGGGGSASSTPIGNDISYPQCGGAFPSGAAFGVVGVNDGLANDLNPCFGPSASYPSYTASELYWAAAATTGGTNQPDAQLYVNTGDPGNVYDGQLISDWPTSSQSDDPYGACTTTTVSTTDGTASAGADSPACAWQYGYNKAAQDAQWLASAAGAINSQETAVPISVSPGSYPWWLDVETANTWQTGSAGLQMNIADLQGVVAGLRQAGATQSIGVYSTTTQWTQITGGTDAATLNGVSNTLYGVPDWIPGAHSLSGAKSACAQASFTGGTVTLTQWFAHPYDDDYAC